MNIMRKTKNILKKLGKMYMEGAKNLYMTPSGYYIPQH